MTNTTTFLAALVVGVAAVGISVAPPAAADNGSSCQAVGATTLCGQGDVRSAGPSAGPPGPASGPATPSGGGCLNPYGGYRNCNTGR